MAAMGLNVAYVITRADVMGGASVHLLDLAMGAKYSGHKITVLAGGSGILLEHLQALGIAHISLKHMKRDVDPLSDLRAYRELRRHLSILKPDIVHAHSSKAGVLARLAAKSLSMPVIFTAHGWAFTEGVSTKRRILYRAIERHMVRYSDHIITVSHYDRRLALQNGVGTEGLITTIHNGVHDTDERRAPRPASSPLKLIMVARFDKPKDQLGLLREFSRLEPGSATLELVGEGTELDKAMQTAEALRLGDRIMFAGWCSDIGRRVADSDVFVLASDWEGLPLSILEAMRAGLPVIASDVGGVAEAVEDGETGILIRRGDSDAFVHAISLFIEHPDLVPAMGQKARQKYENEFRYQKMLDATLALYQRVTPKADFVGQTL